MTRLTAAMSADYEGTLDLTALDVIILDRREGAGDVPKSTVHLGEPLSVP